MSVLKKLFLCECVERIWGMPGIVRMGTELPLAVSDFPGTVTTSFKNMWFPTVVTRAGPLQHKMVLVPFLSLFFTNYILRTSYRWFSSSPRSIKRSPNRMPN